MKEILELFLYSIFIILWFSLTLIIILLLTVKPLDYIRCHQIYDNTQYKILWWCMIKYNWKYIPEHLYIKTFEQNINLK